MSHHETGFLRLDGSGSIKIDEVELGVLLELGNVHQALKVGARVRDSYLMLLFSANLANIPCLQVVLELTTAFRRSWSPLQDDH